MKKVIVTGATGFVGRALTEKLLRTGKEVTAVVRNPGKINDLSGLGKLKVVQSQLSCYDRLPGLLDEKDYDVFYHLAWEGVYGREQKKDYALQLKSVKGACDAVKAAAALGCRKFVYAGTIRQYESCDKTGTNGEAPKYTNLYALCKDMAEKLCRIISVNEGIEFCTGLIALGYGEGSMSEMLPNLLIRQLLQGTSPKLMDGNKRYELIYISDIVDALVAIGEKGKDQRTYYIGHRDVRTFKQLITGIGDIVNPEVKLEFGSYKDSYDIDYSAIDVDALYNDTGFECKADFRESITKTMEWIKKQEK